MGIQNLYEQELLDHSQNPRNFGLFELYDFISPMYNPSCGDSVTMCAIVSDGKISRIAFQGKGCVLSVAMASKLTEFALDKKLDDLLALDDALVEQLLKMQLGLKRMQCGMLSLMALQKGIKSYLEKNA
jgi:nitrogen fixation NifU-like protein